jgi:Spy/CpxP family protein refolding chaperone
MVFMVFGLGGAAFLGGAGEATARGWFRHGTHDPEVMRERAAFTTEWVLSRVDATEEQQKRAAEIVQGTLADLAPLHRGGRRLHEEVVALLSADTIDRAALEELRARKLAEWDTASREIVAAVADLGDLLTHEQRLELAEMADRWHRPFGG